MNDLAFPTLSGTTQEYVYGFSSEDGCVKIGRTVDVKARLGAHRSRQNAVSALFLLKRHSAGVARAIEREVKRALSDKLKRGNEWFACSPEELEMAIHKAEAVVGARPAENMVYVPVALNWDPGVCKSGNEVAVHVLVPAEMRDALSEVAKHRKWSLAVTVREAIERLVNDELAAMKVAKNVDRALRK